MFARAGSLQRRLAKTLCYMLAGYLSTSTLTAAWGRVLSKVLVVITVTSGQLARSLCLGIRILWDEDHTLHMAQPEALYRVRVRYALTPLAVLGLPGCDSRWSLMWHDPRPR